MKKTVERNRSSSRRGDVIVGRRCPATVGSWIGSGHQSGAHTCTLPNSWSYATGTYNVTLNYTLATPYR